MTILHPRSFAQSPAAGFDGVFDWDFLLPAFEGTRIKPMDIDCVVEKNGRFVGFETKSPGKEIPLGQRRTLEALAASGRWKIVILKTKRAEDIDGWEIWERRDGAVHKKQCKGDAKALVATLRRWFDHVSVCSEAWPLPEKVHVRTPYEQLFYIFDEVLPDNEREAVRAEMNRRP